MPSRGRASTAEAGADRSARIGTGRHWTSNWALRIVLIAAGLRVAGYVLGTFWSVVFPVVLGLLVTSVLWPATAWLRRHRWPPALTAATVLFGGPIVVGGAFALIIPSVISQAVQLADQTSAGLGKV